MAGASVWMRAGWLVWAAMLAIAPVAAAQQTVEQPVYVPSTQSRIETAPLPPIGSDAAAGDGGGAAAEGTGVVGVGEGPPRPRFLRVPQDQGRDEKPAAGEAPGQEASGRWESSPDRRFHRAPRREVETDHTTPAPVVPIEPPQTDLRAGARLRELDKMTGQTKTFEISVGETRDVDRLRVRLDGCRSPEGNDIHGTMAFLKIWDTKYPQAEAAFSGWMFAESPALSALDHPRYDLWVISCTTSAIAASDARR